MIVQTASFVFNNRSLLARVDRMCVLYSLFDQFDQLHILFEIGVLGRIFVLFSI
jgi:hypothetical protein